jgi:uncharacterized protein (DUF2132 family)
MTTTQANNPLHGITLETVLTTLVARYGWTGLCEHINLQCFFNNPSIKSSLKFLRKTPWARQKVEDLFLTLPRESRDAAKATPPEPVPGD